MPFGAPDCTVSRRGADARPSKRTSPAYAREWHPDMDDEANRARIAVHLPKYSARIYLPKI
jgi:hypothetical protein